MTQEYQSLEGTALVLDFGSVISYSVFERHAAIERRLGLEPGSIQWFGPIDPEKDKRWREMLADQLTEREYWAEMAQAIGQMVGQEWQVTEFLNAVRSPDINDEIRPEICALVETVKARGAKLAVLSNELELFYGEGMLKQIAILAAFDTIVDATYTKILKPDPRAYWSVLDRLGLSPAQAVFVDDQPRNVAGAEAIGMPAVWFDVRDPAGSIDQALSLLQSASARQKTERE